MRGPRRLSARRRPLPRRPRLSVPSRAQQVPLVEKLEPVHLVDHLAKAPQPVQQALGQLEAEVKAVGRRWNSRSRPVATAVCRGPFSSTKGCKPAGRGKRTHAPTATSPAPRCSKVLLRAAKTDRPEQPRDIRSTSRRSSSYRAYGQLQDMAASVRGEGRLEVRRRRSRRPPPRRCGHSAIGHTAQ